MGETLTHLHAQLAIGRSKYAYFLLAVAASAIALSVRVTSQAILTWSLLPLGLAVVSWGISFYAGCQALRQDLHLTWLNMEQAKVSTGQHELVGTDPQKAAFAERSLRMKMEEHAARLERSYEWQFRFLIIGGVWYLAWHICEMYNRTVNPGIGT